MRYSSSVWNLLLTGPIITCPNCRFCLSPSLLPLAAASLKQTGLSNGNARSAFCVNVQFLPFKRLLGRSDFQMALHLSSLGSWLRPAGTLASLPYSTIVPTVLLFVALATGMSVGQPLSGTCPSSCKCVPGMMTCTGHGLRSIPSPHSETLERLIVHNQTFIFNRLDAAILANLTSREFGGQIALKQLILRYCGLVSLAPYTFRRLGRQLRQLDLSGNPLASLGEFAFAGLRLQYLSLTLLSRAPDIPDAAFADLDEVVNLLLADSQLTHLPAAPFLRLARQAGLVHLDLRGNRLTRLEPGFDAVFAGLQQFWLDGNNWTCDCRLAWLVRRYRSLVQAGQTAAGASSAAASLSSSLQRRGAPVCHEPAEFAGRSFDSLIADLDHFAQLRRAASDAITVATVPFLLCPPPSLRRVEVDLRGLVADPDVPTEPSVSLACQAVGSSDLVVRWVYHASTPTSTSTSTSASTGSAVRASYLNESGLQAVHAGFEAAGWRLPVAVAQADLPVRRIGQLDVYSCHADDVSGNASAVVRIKWPASPSPSPSPSPYFPPSPSPSPSPLAGLDGGSDERSVRSAKPSYLYSKQFSLVEMLGAVMGTFLCTVLLFLLVYRSLLRGSRRLGLLACLVPGAGKLSRSSDEAICSRTRYCGAESEDKQPLPANADGVHFMRYQLQQNPDTRGPGLPGDGPSSANGTSSSATSSHLMRQQHQQQQQQQQQDTQQTQQSSDGQTGQTQSLADALSNHNSAGLMLLPPGLLGQMTLKKALAVGQLPTLSLPLSLPLPLPPASSADLLTVLHQTPLFAGPPPSTTTYEAVVYSDHAATYDVPQNGLGHLVSLAPSGLGLDGTTVGTRPDIHLLERYLEAVNLSNHSAMPGLSLAAVGLFA
ncbi:unnamed protein product, partial [Protopolystoma xenopodis]